MSTEHDKAASAIPGDPGFVHLDDYGFLAVEGSNASEFLQGQLTCNVLEAECGKPVPGAYCTPKGRVISSFVLCRFSPERVIMRMRADILDSTIEVLSRYGVFSRVRIGRCEPQMSCFGLLGNDLRECLDELRPAWKLDAEGCFSDRQSVLIRLDRESARAEIWTRSDAADEMVAVLRSRFPAATGNAWRLALVRSGSAEIQAATRDLFLPQMLHYDKAGAVSFRKGCYTGQEIVARAHYRGSVKRHLYRIGSTGTEAPAPGTELVDASGSRGVATVIEAARDGDGGCELLVVANDDVVAGEAVLARLPGGGNLRVLPLGYTML